MPASQPTDHDTATDADAIHWPTLWRTGLFVLMVVVLWLAAPMGLRLGTAALALTCFWRYRIRISVQRIRSSPAASA